jgi:DNA-binding winged helix-turn-helix (wHTH) protein/Tol biopolymer transport system component
MIAAKPSVFRFADVTVREREFAIVKAGHVRQLEPKAFRLLLILIRNPNKLIAKEELLNSVWEDTAITENSLARNVSLLRRALGDDPREPRFIETVSSIGYRFVCPVEASEDREDNGKERGDHETLSPNGGNGVTATGDSGPCTTNGRNIESEPVAQATSLVVVSAKPRLRLRRWGWALAVTTATAALPVAGAAWYLHRPLPPPRITGYTQITHDGHEKALRGTDGSRLYFNQASFSIAQAAISGGEIAQIPVSFPNPVMLDISPDESSALVVSQHANNALGPLWNVRIVGGSIRRLGDAVSAAFSPDGNSAVYSTEDGDNWGGIYVVRSDGTGVHKLASALERVDNLAWSPDGAVIRFDMYDKRRIWEIASNGSNLHQFLPDWRPTEKKCCGRWTPDGKFFLFLMDGHIWALDERRRLFRRQPAEPVQLTTGPMLWGGAIPSKDGGRIFAQGVTPHGELSRWDSKTKQFLPFLRGISGQGVAFSNDANSIAYVSYPEGILWKANRDGSNPVQLSDPPMQAFLPRWSPDSTQIAFTVLSQGWHGGIYIVSPEDGNPRKLLPEDLLLNVAPTWSPDGRKIVFNSLSDGKFDGRVTIRILDLDSRLVTTVPGSDGMTGPRWSPDGRYLAAGTVVDSTHLMIFDFTTQHWSELAQTGPVDSPEWSRDGKFIYFKRVLGDRGVFRIRVKGGPAEKIADLKDWHDAGWWGAWMALDPTDAPLLLRDIASADIYALTFDQK